MSYSCSWPQCTYTITSWAPSARAAAMLSVISLVFSALSSGKYEPMSATFTPFTSTYAMRS